jgi:hypothetical protein
MKDKYVIKIQRFYRKHKFIQYLCGEKCNRIITKLYTFKNHSKYINMFDKDKMKNNSYNELKKFITNKFVKNHILKLLNHIYNVYGFDKDIATKISVEKFLIAWIIFCFPDYSINMYPSEINVEQYQKEIYDIVCKLIYNLNSLKQNYQNKEEHRKFKISFNKYSNAIIYFLWRDRNKLIEISLGEYLITCKTLDNIINSVKYYDNKYEALETIKDYKKKIESRLSTFGVTSVELCIMYKITTSIEKNIKKAIYDLLVKDIQDKKLVYFNMFMVDIINRFISLGALKIDESFLTKLDKDFITQKITMLPLTVNSSNEYGNYMVEILAQLQSETKIENTFEQWYMLKQLNIDATEHLARMLVFILNELKELENEVESIKLLTKYSK